MMEKQERYICTNCGKQTDDLRTEHKRNINGKFINLIPIGSKLCMFCVEKLGLPNLNDLNKNFNKKI